MLNVDVEKLEINKKLFIILMVNMNCRLNLLVRCMNVCMERESYGKKFFWKL